MKQTCFIYILNGKHKMNHKHLDAFLSPTHPSPPRKIQDLLAKLKGRKCYLERQTKCASKDNMVNEEELRDLQINMFRFIGFLDLINNCRSDYISLCR